MWRAGRGSPSCDALGSPARLVHLEDGPSAVLLHFTKENEQGVLETKGVKVYVFH